MPTKLKVSSPLGTFTRTTVRTYTHLVVVRGKKHETLEAQRLRGIASWKKEAAKYREVIAAGFDRTDRNNGGFDQKFTAEKLADGSYAKWATECETSARELEARGPITEDGDNDAWAFIGWCGRLDLAQKLYAQQDDWRHVAIVSVADGSVVFSR
jgi:hypothetical protein